MKTKNKKILIISILAVLTLMNTSALITIFYYKHHSKSDRCESYRHDRKTRKRHHKKTCLFVQKKLDLNDKQFKAYSQLRQENFDSKDQYIKKIKYYKLQIISELNADSVDEQKMNQFADSIGNQHRLLQLEMNTHFLKVKGILNKDQLVEFRKLMNKMGNPHDYHKRKSHRKCQ